MSGFAETVAALMAVLGLAGAPNPVAHGYAEGEYRRIAAPAAGTLEELGVRRGQRVERGAPLFAIDRTLVRAERDRLAAALAQTRAQLADLGSGKRSEEIAVHEAQLEQAQSAMRRARIDFDRQRALSGTPAGTAERLDAARATFEQAAGRVSELAAQIAADRLPARAAQIRAAEEGVRVAEAALAQQERRLVEQAPAAPVAALVEDTLYTQGEWVPAGSPVVSLLPPDGVKLIVYVPETALSALRPGLRLPVSCDGCAGRPAATVAYIAPQAEYTPPVIYSVGSREKLVYRVELTPDAPAVFAPGQPVDVELPS
jgi:HlyD family secretion protein